MAKVQGVNPSFNVSIGRRQPPSVAQMGLTSVWVICTRDGCKRSVALEWDKLGLHDDLPFSEIGGGAGSSVPDAGPGGKHDARLA